MVTLYRCPDCGRLQVYRNGDDEGLLVVDDADYFSQTPRTCCYEVSRSETRTERKGCGARLWQFSREIGGTDGRFQEGFARLGGGVVTYEGREVASTYRYRTQNGWTEATGYRPLRIIPPEPVEIKGKAVPGKVRWPLVRWLAKQHPDKVGTVVVDEVHGYKGQSTDAGYALGQLVSLADRALLMTGTLFGGYASTVFFIAHRASPAFRRRFKFTELQRFVERYGVLEKKTVEKEYEVENKGQTTLVTRHNTYVKELPGVSPALITLFLDFALFSSLSDLGVKLPDVERRILPVRLDREHQRAYDAYRDDCIQAMKDAKEQTNASGEESPPGGRLPAHAAGLRRGPLARGAPAGQARRHLGLGAEPGDGLPRLRESGAQSPATSAKVQTSPQSTGRVPLPPSGRCWTRSRPRWPAGGGWWSLSTRPAPATSSPPGSSRCARRRGCRPSSATWRPASAGPGSRSTRSSAT